MGQFGLDKASLAAACDAQRAATEAAIDTIEAYNAAMAVSGSGSSAGEGSSDQHQQRQIGSATDAAPAVPITADNLDFATAYAAYIDFASGKTATPVPSPALGLGSTASASAATAPAATSAQGLSVADRTVLSQRLRWRSLIDALVAEDFHHLAPTDGAELLSLSNALHTSKFMDYKVGDAVRQIIAAKHHDFGASLKHSGGSGAMGETSTAGNPRNRGDVSRYSTE